jgi:hypothetical protein
MLVRNPRGVMLVAAGDDQAASNTCGTLWTKDLAQVIIVTTLCGSKVELKMSKSASVRDLKVRGRAHISATGALLFDDPLVFLHRCSVKHTTFHHIGFSVDRRRSVSKQAVAALVRASISLTTIDQKTLGISRYGTCALYRSFFNGPCRVPVPEENSRRKILLCPEY